VHRLIYWAYTVDAADAAATRADADDKNLGANATS